MRDISPADVGKCGDDNVGSGGGLIISLSISGCP